ncbi:MAG: zinc-binding dehydrogenase [Rhodobacteraceae bacterium]|nr:zinc-binding dehydrogenase [Paracoccaceae bacterium]
MSSRTGKVVLFMGVGVPLEAAEFPLPEELEPGAILVRTSIATVCGSDMHSWRGRRPFPTPSVLGHEGLGIIERLGRDISGDAAGNLLSVGDRITWSIMANCGNCYYCTMTDLPQKCQNLFKYGHDKSDVPPYFLGTFGEYVYLKPGTGVFKVPDDMTDEEASPLMCAAATVTGGLDRIDMQTGDTVVIQGAGMLGLYAAAFAKEQGARQVVMIDILDKRLELAKEFGADVCINADGCTDETLIESVHDLTRGIGADLVVEVSGYAKVVPLGAKLLRTGGKYLMQGAVYPNDSFTLDSHDVIIKCLTIKGLHNYHSKYLGRAMELVHKSRSRYPYEKLSGPSFPLTAEGVTSALEALENRTAIRPIVRPQAAKGDP